MDELAIKGLHAGVIRVVELRGHQHLPEALREPVGEVTKLHRLWHIRWGSHRVRLERLHRLLHGLLRLLLHRSLRPAKDAHGVGRACRVDGFERVHSRVRSFCAHQAKSFTMIVW